MRICKYFIFIITVLFLSSHLYGQNNLSPFNSSVALDSTMNFILNKNMDSYTAHFLILDSLDNKKVHYTIYKADIFDNSNKFVQTICDTIPWMSKEVRHMVDRYSDEPQNPIFNNDISFVDINFDGYTDIKIKSFVDMQGQSAFRYFLYTPRSNKFVYDEDFSDLCCNLSINEELKEIYLEDYQMNEEKWTKWTYRVVNNKPILSAIRKEYIFDEDNKQKFRIILEELINGKMKVILDTTQWKGM